MGLGTRELKGPLPRVHPGFDIVKVDSRRASAAQITGLLAA